MISKETIDRIFESSRVEEVIGDFVTLKRAGQNLKGLSPFVNEKTPSFIVSPAKQIWKDFSTGKGGNVVGFLMELESYTYPEALRYLARRYNIEIDEEQIDEESKKAADEKESMYLASEYAAKFFHDTLLNTVRGKAIGLSYFKERGFREETIEKFRLGYSPDEWTAFTDDALAKGYNIKFLEETGLTIVKENGKKFDRFKGRVMFPIQSVSGRILGFGGRTLLTDKKVAKYLNSPESKIYHKSNVLYGIYQAKGEIIKQDNCYLVEGYTDVISLHQNGVRNVVASSGTALTEGQISLIKRFSNNITVLYDGDAAGIKASFRGIDLILEQGMNVKVLTFPDGHDPDSYARTLSTSELQDYLNNNATDFIKFKADLLLKESENDPIKRAGLIRDIVTSIAKIDDKIKREVYVQETSKLLHIDDQILNDELAQIDSRELKKQNQQFVKEQRAKSQMHVVDEPPPELLYPELAQGSPVQSDTSAAKNKIHEEQEKELMHLLIAYGDVKITFYEVEELEDNKASSIRKEVKKTAIETTVLEEIVGSLEDDNLSFKNPFFLSIYNEILEGLDNDELRSASYFLKHQNQEIVSFVANEVSEKHEISPNWEKKNIFVKGIDSYLSQLTEECILSFKVKRIAENIDDIGQQLKNIQDDQKRAELITRLMKLNELRAIINEKLNRIL